MTDYTGAIADYNKAIEINPAYVEAYFYRGRLKFRLKDINGAIADYSKVIEINPKSAQAYLQRGIARINLGDKDGGCIDLDQAGKLGYEKAYEIRKNLCK